MLSNNGRRQALRAARTGTIRRAGRRSLARQTALRATAVLPQQVHFYSTEKILQLRTGKKDTKTLPKTLYNPDAERENCGVGLIASLKSIPSSRIVQQADEMLVRMAHRGGVGSDPASGDGSGKFGFLFLLCKLELSFKSVRLTVFFSLVSITIVAFLPFRYRSGW